MKRRFLVLLLVLACTIALPGVRIAVAAPPAPRGSALIYVPMPSDDALDRFEATGLPAYAQEEDAVGAYVLTGTGEAGLRRLTVAGLKPRVFDTDMTGATYYFAVVPPGRPQPEWAEFGTVLYGDGRRLIRTTPAGAERLAEQGVELAQLTLEPIALQRVQAAHLAVL